jgi:glycosyltransferase involved in cell wall biosynthesis
MLLRAVRRLRDRGMPFHLDVVGVDTLDGAVQRMAAELDLGASVTFHGFLTRTQLRPVLETSHVLLMSSRHETGPIVALEAALAGVPTAGTAVGHLAEWAPDAAATVSPGDDAALAAAVAGLLDDEDRRLALAAAAQRRALREDVASTARSLLSQIPTRQTHR